MPARKGWRAWIEDEGGMVYFDGTVWTSNEFAIAELHSLEYLGIGTSADANNPVSARLNAALWTALPMTEGGNGDLRYKMNKEGARNTVSLLYQSDWSGRAELGLTGSDDFSLKVSPDGESWKDAIRVETGTGDVEMKGLVLDQPAEAPALKIGNGAGSGAAGLGLQFGSEALYTLEVRAGEAPAMHSASEGRIAVFDPGSGLSEGASLVTRDKGDSRYATFDGERTVVKGPLSVWNSLEFTRRGYSYVLFNGQPLTFRLDGADVAKIEASGGSANEAATLLTREKGDARYQRVTSSSRYKENIATADPCELGGLRARTWTWGGELKKDDPQHGRMGYGLIAEEVEPILPTVVHRDADGRVEGLDTLALIAALVEALNRQGDRIASLEARVSALEPETRT